MELMQIVIFINEKGNIKIKHNTFKLQKWMSKHLSSTLLRTKQEEQKLKNDLDL